MPTLVGAACGACVEGSPYGCHAKPRHSNKGPQNHTVEARKVEYQLSLVKKEHRYESSQARIPTCLSLL